tara:strand:- start:286 stop:516 length:231 start_codon:yes stop_codon:yes gene_type:complete
MANKLTENSVVILLLTALAVSQVMTFVRLNEHDKVIDELIDGQSSLFEIIRLQTQLEELRLKSIEELPPYRTGVES